MPELWRRWACEGAEKMKKLHNIIYTNSGIIAAIDEYVHSERDRAILRDRFVNGLTFEQLAERHDVSTRTIKNVIYKHEYIILKYAKREQG